MILKLSNHDLKFVQSQVGTSMQISIGNSLHNDNMLTAIYTYIKNKIGPNTDITDLFDKRSLRITFFAS